MQTDDARYLRRKIRSGSIDVHPTEKALVVNYELEALILGEMGDPMLGDKKEYQKIIRLNSLNAKTDCSALAKEVVDKCSLIHHSKLNEVEHLIRYLKNRKDVPSNNESGGMSDSFSAWGAEIIEKANIANMDSYIEYLYEDTHEKILGSSMILALVKNPYNLKEIAVNEVALSALSRVLREDWKKNVELAANIIQIFSCFSSYSQFHPVIIQYKIGSLCMEVIDHELKKQENLETKKALSPSTQKSPSPASKDVKKRQSMIPIGKRRSDSASKNSASKEDFRKSLPGTPVGFSKLDLLNDNVISNENQKDTVVNKQDQLLQACVQLLLNIAENTKVEEKMRKRNISSMLIKLLESNSMGLLTTCIKFLKKLSVFRENKDDMVDSNVIEKLCKIFSIGNKDLILLTLKLMYNLSFDAEIRERIVMNGLLTKLVSYLDKEDFKEVILGILYHLSMDDKVKSMFAYTECIPMIMNMLLDNKFRKLVIALGINLAINKKNAEIMIADDRLQKFLERAFKNQDSLLMKMIHNIAMHEPLNRGIVEFVGDIAKAVTQCDSEEFVMECIGILGCLTLPELDFNEVFQQFELLPWIKNMLIPGKTEDDMVLEIVILLGTAACDEDCAMLMCKEGILISLIELLKAKQEDDEIVLQIIYMFYQIIRHDSTRNHLILETDAAAYLIDLMQDKNKEIAIVCDSCLDIISEFSNEWKKRIMVDKFRFHNSQWLEMVENQALDDADFALGEDNLPPYLSSDLMQHTMLYPTNSQISLEDLQAEEPFLDLSAEDGSFSKLV
ncbi:Kinesin-associated protein, putative [Pediculus humanus corporis]|uniref:Kinesin-associated protein, putative n=1 Tax=Pediculus humanus subsp. corporis TaxID=121224 RepID=E0VJT6_PEDHC|nr:Kinesin-associated protein, putative [Pediculus humanus corporis]EEB13642.1 Kinesin-associated protein, putative [Pediculus humanus corporis]